jgi:4-amino-4-deoxy-L-arabinose transferase-like glycosyltransferase
VLLSQLLPTLVLLVVCSFAPGFLVVRRLRWSGLEKLCGSVALSLVLLWLAAWGIYIWAQPAAYYGLAAACGLAAIAVAKDAWRLCRGLRVRRALAGYAFLLAWTLLVLAVIRNYSGALWSGDWLEHFQRTLFFLHHFPKDTPIYGGYLLPARPPMMNVLAAFFLGVTQDRFEIFQLVFAFLNLLVFLPCCLAVPMLVRVRKVSLLPLVGIFAMNPAVMQNATYTWTKMLTAFFVVLAVCLYLSGWRKRDSVRLTAAFVALAAGLLAHYSAGPYCVFFALHYLLVVFRTRPGKWKELAAIAIACALLLSTWFGWSMAVYGAKPTFASNTSITATKQIQGSNLAKIAGNVVDSIVPRVSYDSAKAHVLDQPYAPAVVRDNVFLLYQANLILSMGLLGGPLAVWFAIAAFRSGKGLGGERNFWLMLIGFSLVVGLAVVGERDYFGVAHLTLVPMELLGITLLAGRFVSRRRIALLIVAGCAIDFSLGVFFHARVQHLDNTAEHTYFTGLSYGSGQFLIGAPGPDSLNMAAWRNWMAKHHIVLCEKWLGLGEAYRRGDPAVEAAKVDLRAGIAERLEEDGAIWRGWYRRNGGEFELMGDHFGGGDATSVVLALAALGLLWTMARQAPRVDVAVLNAVAARKPRSSRSRHKR